MSFVNKNNLNQFGFRKNYSTTHAIISLIENIEKAISNKQLACVFIDLEKYLMQLITTFCLKKYQTINTTQQINGLTHIQPIKKAICFNLWI